MNVSLRLSGNVFMLGYVLTTALSTILIHDATQQISPLLSAFYTFLFCIVLYGFLSNEITKKFQALQKFWREIVALNVTTAICWIFTFFSLKMIEPELYLFMYLCSMTVASAVFCRGKFLKNLFLLAGLAVLSCTYQDQHLYAGIVLACLGGVSGAVYSIFSKRVTHVFTTQEILYLRFYLIVFLTFALNIIFGKIQIMPVDFYVKFGLISLLSIVLPLTLFQLGLKYLKVNQALSWLPLAPLSCYFIDLISHHNSFMPLQFVAVLMLSVTLFF